MPYQDVMLAMNQQIHRSLPEQQQRLFWDRKQIDEFQLKELRLLLQHANLNSKYYQKRLKGLDLDNFTLNDLQKIEPTSKKEAMDNWDDIICVPGITREMAEKHLDKLNAGEIDNPFYDDQYYFLATGGSSGLRGFFAWDTQCLIRTTQCSLRIQYNDEQNNLIPGKHKMALLTAPSLVHGSTTFFSLVTQPDIEIKHIPASLKIDDICEQLEEFQPTHINGFSSIVGSVSERAALGKLNINPKRIITHSEPLEQQTRDNVQKAWGIGINNIWGSVEMGLAATEDDNHLGLLVSEDAVILEPVDTDLNPATTNPSKLLSTNLVNNAFPLIRYIVDDVVNFGTSPKTAYKIVKSIEGRTDDAFVYPSGQQVHPMVFRHVLGQDTDIEEYQVEQTLNGAIIRIVAPGLTKTQQIKSKLEQGLSELGIEQPSIEIESMQKLPRHKETGKLKRFIPLR